MLIVIESLLKKIAVLGAGHVGHACSADLSLGGYNVTLYELPELRENLKPILNRGGIEITGKARTGFAKLGKITSQIEEALKGAELIQICVPGFGHRRFSEVCVPYIDDGQTVVFYGCGGGALTFAKTMKDMKIKKRILLGETNLPPYVARRTGLGEVNVFVKNDYLLAAAFPARDTDRLVEILKEIYPAVAQATNVLETLLCQVNSVGHPAATLLNVGRIEYSGPFRLWREGVTPSVANVIEAVDNERLAVMKALGLRHLEPYHELGAILGLNPPAKSIYEAINAKRIVPLNPTDVKNHRYVSEDVPYGIVTMASIADMIGVETPVTNSLISLFSTMNKVDYWSEGRTVEKMGISGLSVEELKEYVNQGELRSAR